MNALFRWLDGLTWLEEAFWGGFSIVAILAAWVVALWLKEEIFVPPVLDRWRTARRRWRDRLGRYVLNNLIALDQALNAAFGGDPDETVSSRLGRRVRRRGALPWYLKPVGWALEKIDPGHLEESIEK